ncbi:DUF4249 domain-containing protein [Ekhidna sp.]|uniref:DUF4249 domain-containing protein n=1 Tax=Ekhidna sp. TaxID=2608089 RepID=UPI0035139F86
MAIILIVTLPSCIQPHDIQMHDQRRALVVDAIVTNIPGRQSVRLEYSYSLVNSHPELLSGALVRLSDDMGNNIEFNETSLGTYQPEPSFAGIVGRKYKIFIQTPDGDEYESKEEELLEPAKISAIYGRYLSLRSESSGGFDEGVQFLVDIVGGNSESSSYRLEYQEDYEIMVPYPSQYEYYPSTRTIERRSQSLRLCYINEQSNNLLIASTGGQINNELREFPVRFITEDEPNLIGRYSLNVIANRISSSAYQYYKDLKENNESGGSFFDRQKGPLIGNIMNINNLSEPVLGYFEVSGISEEFRIFEAGSWKEDGYIPKEILQSCKNSIDTVRTVEILNGNISFNGRLIYNFAPTDGIVPGTTYNTETLIVPEVCADCRALGSLTKPIFWN